MKKLIFTLFALVGMVTAASAQSVSAADVEALPGETVKATLNFDCPSEIGTTGMQIQIQFPATGFTVAESSDTYYAVDGFAGSLEYSFKDGLVKFACASSKTFTSTAIDVEFTVEEGIENDEYEVTISGVMEGAVDSEVSGSFKVNVVSAHTVVLDENSTTAPEDAEGVNVTVKRTINANEWSTICLPFAMTEAQMTAAFGEGVELADFDGYVVDDEDAPTAITVNFVNASTIEANHPYIIKVSNAVSSFTVEKVDIVVDDPAVEHDNGKTGRNRVVYDGFYGTYVAGTEIAYSEDGDRNVFLSGGKFWYATESTKSLKGYRCYFWFIDELTEGDSSRFAMNFGEKTGIKNVNYQIDGKYYDLNGLRVETPTKGIYIKDGKKVVVK